MKKTVQTLLLFICFCCFATGQQSAAVATLNLKSPSANLMPDRWIGNWINCETNHWDYGFFEKFAIYRNDFWDYQTIETDKKGEIALTLVKGRETVQLKLKQGKNNQITIGTTKGKALRYSKMDKTYPAYPQKDESSFAQPTFRNDSATIIGYYRNMDKIPAQFAARLSNTPFRVGVPNFINDRLPDYTAAFDSLGRFRITFPIMNMQELFVDWKRISLQMMVEPGNTIFLYVDLADFIPQEADMNMDGYRKRPKELLFMGDNARINNELFTYKAPSVHIDRNKGKTLTDMKYLSYCDSVYQERLAGLNAYIKNHPTVSEKFRLFVAENERYNLAFYLLQHRFDLIGKGKTKFDEGYMDYVQARFPLNNEWTFTGLRDFKMFLRDYIGYETSLKPQRAITITFKDISKYIRQNKNADDATLSLLDQVTAMNEEFEKSGKDQAEALQIKYKDLIAKIQTIQPLLREVSTEIFAQRPLDTHIADSLLTNEHLRQMWSAGMYYAELDQHHKALSDVKMNDMKAKVVNPDLIKTIDDVNSFYKNVATKGMTYEASLKSTEKQKGLNDGKVLFEELIQPYKGKVIYVDFWGTWCGPCKENMTYVKGIKEKLKGQDVVFMYFANNSPEDSWKNIIKEMDLTGENVVHYRLPDQQEKLVEQLFSVTKFPTYLLVNKEGKVVNIDAAAPMLGDMAIKQITELLK